MTWSDCVSWKDQYSNILFKRHNHSSYELWCNIVKMLNVSSCISGVCRYDWCPSENSWMIRSLHEWNSFFSVNTHFDCVTLWESTIIWRTINFMKLFGLLFRMGYPSAFVFFLKQRVVLSKKWIASLIFKSNFIWTSTLFLGNLLIIIKDLICRWTLSSTSWQTIGMIAIQSWILWYVNCHTMRNLWQLLRCCKIL